MIIGIGGVSRSGKTSLAKALQAHFRDKDKKAVILHQDEYVFPEEQIPKIRGKVDWEDPTSIDFERFREDILEYEPSSDVLIAEGLFAFYDAATNTLYDRAFFLTVAKATFLERKEKDLRWGKEPAWYIEHIWNSFQKYGHPRGPMPPTLYLNGERPLDWSRVLAFLH